MKKKDLIEFKYMLYFTALYILASLSFLLFVDGVEYLIKWGYLHSLPYLGLGALFFYFYSLFFKELIEVRRYGNRKVRS